MRSSTRHAPNDARRPRKPLLTLGVKRGHEVALLAGEQTQDSDLDAAAQLFADWLCMERNRWDIGRRQGLSGLFANHKRWTRHDAERAWSVAFGTRKEMA